MQSIFMLFNPYVHKIIGLPLSAKTYSYFSLVMEKLFCFDSWILSQSQDNHLLTQACLYFTHFIEKVGGLKNCKTLFFNIVLVKC